MVNEPDPHPHQDPSFDPLLKLVRSCWPYTESCGWVKQADRHLEVVHSACDDGFRIDWCDWLEWLCALIMEVLPVVFIVTVEGGDAVNGE